MLGIENLKIILALFVALLLVLLIENVVNEAFHREPLERAAYQVLTSDEPEPEAPAETEPEPVLEPVTAILAAADPAAGEKLTRRCTSCHTFNEGGANKVGPNLWDIVGREKGTVDGARYSDAMKEAGGTWSFEDLNGFIADPKAFLAGTSMGFKGIKNVEDRAALIAYMRAQSSNPAPLP